MSNLTDTKCFQYSDEDDTETYEYCLSYVYSTFYFEDKCDPKSLANYRELNTPGCKVEEQTKYYDYYFTQDGSKGIKVYFSNSTCGDIDTFLEPRSILEIYSSARIGDTVADCMSEDSLSSYKTTLSKTALSQPTALPQFSELYVHGVKYEADDCSGDQQLIETFVPLKDCGEINDFGFVDAFGAGHEYVVKGISEDCRYLYTVIYDKGSFDVDKGSICNNRTARELYSNPLFSTITELEEDFGMGPTCEIFDYGDGPVSRQLTCSTRDFKQGQANIPSGVSTHETKCLWDTGCKVDRNDCEEGTICKDFGWWSQCQEKEFQKELENTKDAEECYQVINGPFPGRRWGCQSDKECCNPAATCGSDQLCHLPCSPSSYDLGEKGASGGSNYLGARGAWIGGSSFAEPVVAVVGDNFLPVLALLIVLFALLRRHCLAQKSVDTTVSPSLSELAADSNVDVVISVSV